MKIDDAQRHHIQAVQAWLEKNVRVYPTPSRISLRQIQLDFNTLRGEALLFVGDALPGEALTLRMGDDGWLTFTPPLFHSPLGAPATYGAIELTDKTKQAVAAAVQGLTSALDQFLSADIDRFIGEPSIGANVLLTNGRFCIGAVGQRRSRKLNDVLSGRKICP